MSSTKTAREPELNQVTPALESENVKRDRRIRRIGGKVWIDLENSPHIPFFDPIIKELKERGCEVVLTARDCFQVCELADMAGLKYQKIGHHYGKNPIAKVVGLGIRVLQMMPFVLREKPAISVCHGSRTLLVLSALLGIRSINISDYEHANHSLTTWLGSSNKQWVMTPDVIPSEAFEKNGMLKGHVLHYPGIKEDVYTPFFEPDPTLKDVLGLKETEIVVTVRPPATEAHYHNPESEKLLLVVFELVSANPRVKVILLPRTHKQEAELREAVPHLFAEGRRTGSDLVLRRGHQRGRNDEPRSRSFGSAGLQFIPRDDGRRG